MRDELIRQIEEAADDIYQVVGEIGGDPSRLGFLARERATGVLVALSLVSDELRVLTRLDASVPVDGSSCANCRAALGVWSDGCPACGARIVSDAFPGADTPEARRLLLKAVMSASRGEYEVIGAMDGGAGSVYFARELKGGRLVALALQAEDEEDDACSLVTTWIAPGATPELRAVPVLRDPASMSAPETILPIPERARPGRAKRLFALAALIAVFLIVVAYVRAAPEPASDGGTPAVETRR